MNCQPGDLAISVNTERPENEGRIVRVIRRHVNSPEWNYRNRPAWWCESDEPLLWYFRFRGEYHFSNEGAIPDDCLRPIRPGELDTVDAQPVSLQA